MAKASRKLPRGAKPARRPLRTGGSADGYLQGGTFYAFDSTFGLNDFTGSAYADNTMQCDSSSYDSGNYGGSSGCDSSSSSDSGSSYSDSGSSGSSYDSGGSSYDSGSSSSSYDSGGSSSSYDSGSY